MNSSLSVERREHKTKTILPEINNNSLKKNYQFIGLSPVNKSFFNK